MSKIKIVIFASFLLSASCTTPAVTVYERATSLSSDNAQIVLEQCSRGTPDGVDGTWTISPAILAQIEQDFHKITTLASDGKSVKEPNRFFRQYAGITIRGKKYIYINAFRSNSHNVNWREEPVLACDGGASFWGALYDPESREFSQLAFNGEA